MENNERLTRAKTPSPNRAADVEQIRGAVSEQIDEEKSGFWYSCTGCHESGEYCSNSHNYPYSEIFKCHPGSGCGECGGIGVRWDGTDYEETAKDIGTHNVAAMGQEAKPTTLDQQPQSGDAVKVIRSLRYALGSFAKNASYDEWHEKTLELSDRYLATLTDGKQEREEDVKLYQKAWLQEQEKCIRAYESLAPFLGLKPYKGSCNKEQTIWAESQEKANALLPGNSIFQYVQDALNAIPAQEGED